MSPYRMTEADFKMLTERNVNPVRFLLMRNRGRLGTELDLADYDRWINARPDRLAGELDLAARHGIKAVNDLHTPPALTDISKIASKSSEEYGWDWSYHAFREWNGWSLEHEGESHVSMRPSPDNSRKRVLLKYFSRNTAE